MMDPKKYIVKIDKRSVRPNPDAGSTMKHLYLGSTSKVTLILDADTDPAKLETKMMRLEYTNMQINGSGTYFHATYRLSGSSKQVWRKVEQLIKRFEKRIQYEVQNEYRGINLLHPEPAYLYRHRSTMVQCCGCKKRFPHNQLIEESGNVYDGIPDIDNGCPICEMGDCCIIEYETIGDYLLKQNGIPKKTSGVG